MNQSKMNFSGYDCNKPTSRVLNPPGGRSNNIFGAYEEPRNGNTKQSNVLNDNTNGNQEANKTDRNRSNIFCEQPAQQSNKQRRGFNPITGRPYDEEERQPQQQQQQQHHHQQQQQQPQQSVDKQPEPQQDGQQQPSNNYHSSTRIFHPPGGKSTKLW